MKIITIQEPQREELLSKIQHVFKRKTRPDTTPIHYRKVVIKRED
jgi:hypothetical protein